ALKQAIARKAYGRTRAVFESHFEFYSSTLYLILWRRCQDFVWDFRATRLRFKWYFTIAIASSWVRRGCDTALFTKRSAMSKVSSGVFLLSRCRVKVTNR